MRQRDDSSCVWLGYSITGGAKLGLRIEDETFKNKSLEDILKTPLYKQWEKAFQKMVEGQIKE